MKIGEAVDTLWRLMKGLMGLPVVTPSESKRLREELIREKHRNSSADTTRDL